jgi:sporulation protein YlmC with PRC-barrel domain
MKSSTSPASDDGTRAGRGFDLRMRLDLGHPVHCSDAEFGELADVVIDPTTRRVTHLVVEPHGRHELARLVPIERARAADAAIALDCTAAEVEQLKPLHEVAYLRLGEFPVDDPNWDVGVEDMLGLPYYQGIEAQPIDYDPHVTVGYDRVPKGEVEIRRASAVSSADGHHLGHVDGFVVGGDEHISDIVLERGHLWGKREVVIPIGAVERVESDEVVLKLSKDEVGALKSRHVRRWRS